jgi:Nucleotidyl transferase AbiEii toxin, Type IV TA system
VTARTLAERVTALDEALRDIPHAFGGALALAYYAEPRATIDIDLNVFVTADRFNDVAGPLLDLGATVDDSVAELVRGDGQARVMWDRTPIDLFFAYDPFHHAAARAVRTVPFAAGTIPILSPEHLVVCKAVFNRARDWVDIDAMLENESPLDAAEILRWVGRIAGDTDPRFERLVSVLVG